MLDERTSVAFSKSQLIDLARHNCLILPKVICGCHQVARARVNQSRRPHPAWPLVHSHGRLRERLAERRAKLLNNSAPRSPVG